MNSDLENTLSLFCVLFKFIGSHCDKDGGVVTVCIGVWQVVRLTIVASEDKAGGFINKNQNPVKLSTSRFKTRITRKELGNRLFFIWIIIIGLHQFLIIKETRIVTNF